MGSLDDLEDATHLEAICSRARAAWLLDGAALLAEDDDGDYEEATRDFEQSLRLAYRVGWDIEPMQVPVGDLDRRRGIMNGPLYTSEKYPWPIGKHEYYLVPIVQIDLAEVSALSGHTFGSGLAQLWQDEVSMVTRIIPEQDFRSFEPSVVPAFVADGNIEQLQFDLGDQGLPSFLSNSHQITGFAGPYIFGPWDRDELLDRYIASPLCSASLALQLSALRHAVQVGRDRFSQITRLLGSFNPVQVRPEDHPPALFSSDDDSVLNTGDSGMVAMFAKIEAEGTILSGIFNSC